MPPSPVGNDIHHAESIMSKANDAPSISTNRGMAG